MEDNSKNERRLTAAELIAESRRTITLSGGATVVIGRISPSAFAQAMKGIPDLTSLAADVDAGRPEDALKKPGAEALFTAMEHVVSAALIDPRLGVDRAAGPAVADLPMPDIVALFMEILNLSGMTRANAARVVPFSGSSA